MRELDAPRYANFWSNNIDIKNLNVKMALLKGHISNLTGMLHPGRLFIVSSKTGKLKIEPLTLDVSAQVPSNRRDFFGLIIYFQC